MGADSGLPTLENSSRVRAAWPALRELGLDYKEMCQARWFKEDPRLAWGFWRHCCDLYRQKMPHKGYEIVRSLAKHAAGGGFVCTTNVDSHWAMSSWPDDRLLELHGAAHFLQCAGACHPDTWPAPERLGLSEDPETHRAIGVLPTCPRCGGVARPFVQMFGDDEGFSTALLAKQRLRCEEWHDAAFQQISSGYHPRVVCLELGCGPGSAARMFLEQQAGTYGSAKLIRVNCKHSTVSPSLVGRAVSIPLGALEALQRMAKLDSVLETVSYIVQDADGNGAEVMARRDACAAHVCTKAVSAVGGKFHLVETEGPVKFTAQSVLQENHQMKELRGDEPCPVDFAYVCRDADPPITRVLVSGMRFLERNEAAEERMHQSFALLTDLLREFSDSVYQSKLEAATDRDTVTGLIREVHCRVLPVHGIGINAGMDAADALRKVMQMQGFLQSGRLTDEMQKALELSVFISGYSKIRALPAAPRPKGARPKAQGQEKALVAVGGKAAPDSKWVGTYRPPKAIWIAGNFNNFDPKAMDWDGTSFVCNVKIPAQGQTSFQLLVEGRWEASVYPSVRDANPWMEYELRGPNDKGHGKNWTIGRHANDAKGEKLKISVAVDAKGAAKRVTWQRG